MTEIKVLRSKNGRKMYYIFNMIEVKSFRISTAKAELMIATGEGKEVSKFFYER